MPAGSWRGSGALAGVFRRGRAARGARPPPISAAFGTWRERRYPLLLGFVRLPIHGGPLVTRLAALDGPEDGAEGARKGYDALPWRRDAQRAHKVEPT